jgi:hypothetical protein
MQAAVITLCLAALGGLTMAILRLAGRAQPPTWMALGHGAIAVTGVVLLLRVAVVSALPPLAWSAVVCFGVAALGGLTMFLGFHRRGRPLPIPLMLAHGGIALLGLTLLLLSP